MSAIDGQSKQPVSPPEWESLHRWLVRICVFFFIWLVLEGFGLVPFLIARYGWH